MRHPLLALALMAPLVGVALSLASPRAGTTETPARPAPDTIRIVLTGDVALNWRSTPESLETFPRDKNPLRFFSSVFKASHLAVSNMEGVLMRRDPKYAEERYNLWAPAASAEVFSQVGVGLVSTANNHAFDGRDRGVLETLAHLRKTGVQVMGTGATEADARRPFIYRRGQACVAFIPATTKSNMPVRGRAQVAFYPQPREEELLALVKKTKAGCPFVVVYIHWGVEMQHFPHRRIKGLAHALVDTGADLVVGHHPHVLQGVELRKGGAIVYSLGNFVFSNPKPQTRRTGLLVVELSGGPRPRLQRLSLQPAQIHRKDYTVRPATPAEAEALLLHMARYSQPFGTQVVLSGGHLRFLQRREILPPRAP